MGLWKSLAGSLRVSYTTADVAEALTAIHHAGLSLYKMEQTDELTLIMTIDRRDYKALQKLANRRGDRLRVLARKGFYWHGKVMLGRPVLLLGMVMLFTLAAFLPTRILFVRVDGNVSIPSRLILEKAEECGIGFWASRRDVRSEKMKNELLSAIPELQWAGVNTSGCVATITVRERTPAEQVADQTGVSRIVASRDGVIQQCTVLHGNALCKVGQAVKAGEVLVSGYTDCGISIQATRAEAEIFALTNRNLTILTPANYDFRDTQIHQEKKYSLIIGKKRINFYKGSGILGSSCVKMYSENYVTLPGGFQLPIALVTEVWSYYDCESVCQDSEVVEEKLLGYAQDYLETQMVAGRILSEEIELTDAGDVYIHTGQYACLEMIGQVRSEEILSGNGKSD